MSRAPFKTVMFMLATFVVLSPPLAASQSSVSASSEVQTPKTIVVPVQAAALLRPILDEVQKGAEHDERRLSNLLYGLTQNKGRAADEALVVLMCFHVGESQEETDAVIARGKKMLPLLTKYQSRNPRGPRSHIPRFDVEGYFQQGRCFRRRSKGNPLRLAQHCGQP